MSVRPLLLLATAMTPASAAHLYLEGSPTEGLPGYRTYTLVIDTHGDEVLRGFAGRMEGSFHQVNPFGLRTVFANNNVVFPAAGVLVEQDTQFLFNDRDVLSIGAEESTRFLEGAITGLSYLALPNPTPIAQLVTQDCDLWFELSFDLGGSEPQVLGAAWLCPEPSAALLAALAVVMFRCVRSPHGTA